MLVSRNIQFIFLGIFAASDIMIMADVVFEMSLEMLSNNRLYPVLTAADSTHYITVFSNISQVSQTLSVVISSML